MKIDITKIKYLNNKLKIILINLLKIILIIKIKTKILYMIIKNNK